MLWHQIVAAAGQSWPPFALVADLLMIGLDFGPNLAVTGSLSAILWLRAARRIGAEPSLVTYSRLGVQLVPLTIAGALAAG